LHDFEHVAHPLRRDVEEEPTGAGTDGAHHRIGARNRFAQRCAIGQLARNRSYPAAEIAELRRIANVGRHLVAVAQSPLDNGPTDAARRTDHRDLHATAAASTPNTEDSWSGRLADEFQLFQLATETHISVPLEVFL
jgi:hypothetical protein